MIRNTRFVPLFAIAVAASIAACSKAPPPAPPPAPAPNQDSIAVYTPPLLCLIEKAGLITLSVKSGQDGQYKVVKSRKVRHEPPPPGAFRAGA